MQPSGDIAKGPMPFSSDTTMFVDNTASDQGEDDWFPISEDCFDDDFDDKHNDCLEDDWGDNSDILNCNHAEGSKEHARAIDLGDVQCDGLIYNSPIVGDNGICSLETLLNDSVQESVNAGVYRPWLILGIKKAVKNTYPNAHQGLCDYHSQKNLKNKFKRDDVAIIFTLARDCYKEFIRDMFQHWFHDRHEQAVNVNTDLSPWATR
ncbi:Uncharacterized protein TCM_025014 [Theobroma cacao]|uniref:Uncharacterized protein n=1 Tax=Theobroma cacao TaxID=3641 RepID=A0A061F506_THECC|nr:Uncharacterized protein TCM_025014 [Theobroma cacao]